jgi:hypothetical protein
MLLMSETFRMLDAFASVGTTGYTLTQTDIHRKSWQNTSSLRYAHDDFVRAVPGLITAATQSDPHNLIIRPHDGPDIRLIQLDDLNSNVISRVMPFSFLIVETSRDNFQAWIALDSPSGASADSKHTDDLVHRLIRGTGADAGANGAVRLVGSPNVKAVHAPDFPRVKLHHVQPGLRVTAATIAISGLLQEAATLARSPKALRWPARGKRGKGWPDYQRCLDGAPIARDGSGPDVSRADYTFCIISARWGWSEADIAAKLAAVSSKAKERGAQYAELTARNAAAEA